MPNLFDTDSPESDSVSIAVTCPPPGNPTGPISTTTFDHFLSYEYASNFLTPADQWSFSIPAVSLTPGQGDALQPGAVVEIKISGLLQTTGYVDAVRVHGSRGSGTILTITGRDWMAPAVDGHVDPQMQFKPSQTLADMMTQAYAFLSDVTFQTDNIANRNVMTGRDTGSTSKKGKTLKSYVLHQLAPYPQESVFQFTSRVAQRFGLWIWPSQDGQSIVVGQPDFGTEPLYQILNSLDPSLSPHNNVLEWDCESSRKDQPSCILATGFGGGGENAKVTLKGGIVNPISSADTLNVQNNYPTVKFTTPPIPTDSSGIGVLPLIDPVPRPMYVVDRDSHNQSEVNSFLQRELSLRVRHALTANYTIEGHRIGGVPIAVDTIVDVQDDHSGLHQLMWIIGRHFRKDAHAGTSTQIQTIRVGSLQF